MKHIFFYYRLSFFGEISKKKKKTVTKNEQQRFFLDWTKKIYFCDLYFCNKKNWILLIFLYYSKKFFFLFSDVYKKKNCRQPCARLSIIQINHPFKISSQRRKKKVIYKKNVSFGRSKDRHPWWYFKKSIK